MGYNWTGLYLGGQIGYGWGDVDASSAPVSGFFNQSYGYDMSGFLGGLHAGYNWQTPGLLFGIETDIEGSWLDGSGTGTLGSNHSADINWMGSVRGRIGLPMNSTLLYMTGGLAYGEADINSPSVSYTDWRTGWTLGGGIEQAFSPNMTARIEYRYTDLGTFEDGLGVDSTALTNSAVRVGLSFKF